MCLSGFIFNKIFIWVQALLALCEKNKVTLLQAIKYQKKRLASLRLYFVSILFVKSASLGFSRAKCP
jgi:hypothetical protein